MKKLIALVSMLVAVTVSAEVCNSGLIGNRGDILDTFSGYGYTRMEACRDALRECNYEKARRSYDRRVQLASCETLDDRRDDHRRGPRVCTFEMIGRRGRVIDVFTETRDRFDTACENAREACERARSIQGRYGATCVKARDDRRDRFETKTCEVERIGRGRQGRTGVLQVHVGVATGPRNSNVQQQACMNAMQECNMEVRRSPRGHNQRCIQRGGRIVGDSFDVFGL